MVSRTYDDPATHGLPGAPWAQKVQTPIEPDVAVWNLGAGESAVLSFAQHNRDYTAIVDDRTARRCAHVLRISIIGTAGVVVLAKRRGLIDSVEGALRSLQGAGLWLSEELILKLAAE